MNKRELVKAAAEAHTNINTWGAVVTILDGGLLYNNDERRMAAVMRVIKIAMYEQAECLREYEAAIDGAIVEKDNTL